MPADFQNSNNPFRRKANLATVAPTLAPNPTPPTDSTVHDDGPPRNHPPSDAATAPATDAKPTERKTKPAKRVRVQTPSPLSSSDSELDSPIDAGSPVRGRWDARDPFDGARGEDEPDTKVPTQPGPPQRNPFSRTLQDIEPSRDHEEMRPPARIPGRASMDVEAFRRLLLTGQTDVNNPAVQPSQATTTPSAAPETAAPTTETTSHASTTSPLTSPRSPGTEPHSSETSRGGTRHPGSDERAAPPRSDEPPSPAQKKKPPPPSSRHGKAIRLQLVDDQSSTTSPPLPRTPSDFNKPLPSAPARTPSDEYNESIFDREAAGKVPESSEPPSPAVSAHDVPAVPKRPTPAPPPRRSRPDGNLPDSRAAVTSPTIHISELQRRSSVDSTHSRTESIRHSAPAPPPPRRPAHRSNPSVTSVAAQPVSTPSTPHFVVPDASHHPTSPRGHPPSDIPSNSKQAPPPPPTRSASTRHKPKNSSVEGVAKRVVTKSGEPAPPPPPRRQRGSSRGSLESPPEILKGPADNGTGAQVGVGTVREMDEGGAGDGAGVATDGGQAGLILADLTALQREVEALQKQYAAGGS
ncbi:uncharacterized protein DNG_02089 [Cephalotrichum gorgonifer]|uniref:Uncharacterized protein n=1 Tax=Cephalotrichum gorgonifer TaxID=2041049 RepID=A0AAE8MUA3_9PEZI|nr:uncharacterized protein DNG_02089 [Cephalotrichum gorgonifer]